MKLSFIFSNEKRTTNFTSFCKQTNKFQFWIELSTEPNEEGIFSNCQWLDNLNFFFLYIFLCVRIHHIDSKMAAVQISKKYIISPYDRVVQYLPSKKTILVNCVHVAPSTFQMKINTFILYSQRLDLNK